jgi:PIN domain nuclease of toxin-antitoxin system
VRLLLDTHALLWLLMDDPQLAGSARDMVTDPAHDVFVSSVSLWEITVKVRVGKLVADMGEIVAACQRMGLPFLEIAPRHLLELAGLPVFADHRDPFDHLLVAQAIAEDLLFVSEDRNTPRYPVRHLRCSGGTVDARP